MTTSNPKHTHGIDTGFTIRQIRKLITLPVGAFAISFFLILSLTLGQQWFEDSSLAESEAEHLLLSQSALITSEVFFEQTQAVSKRLDMLAEQFQSRHPDWKMCIQIRKLSNQVIQTNCSEAELEKAKAVIQLPLKIGDEVIADSVLKADFRGNQRWFLLRIILLSSFFSTLFAAAMIYYLGERIDLQIVSPLLERIRESSRKAATAEMASQVAHDIRSPLSALSLVSATLDEVAEPKRILVRESIKRINDIANNLLAQSKEKNGVTTITNGNKAKRPLQSELMATVVESLVSEKRLQYRDKLGVEIESHLLNSYGLFAKIDSVEFKRALSNLINNAVEALPNETGKVRVNLTKHDGKIQIQVCDNGKGIPASILSKLGTPGVTYGKEGTQSGHGLGLSHAKTTVEACGGDFKLESIEGRGTQVTITVPAADAPDWFVEKLELGKHTKFVSIDDDLTIHRIWRGRLESLAAHHSGVEHWSFSNGPELEAWLKNQDRNSQFLFLVDYELVGQSNSGLDIIENLEIKHQSILVTSRFEEPQIRSRCQQLKVKLIPKGMAGFVPIQVQS